LKVFFWNISKRNPKLKYFTHSWWLQASFQEINGESLKIHILRVSFQSPSNPFRSSSSTHRLFLFVEPRWAFAMKTKGFFKDYLVLLGDSNERSLLELLVSSEPKINRLSSSSSSLIQNYFGPSSSHLKILRDRTLCLNCKGTNSMMKILDESLRIRINLNWFCTIIAELSFALMKIDMILMNFEVLETVRVSVMNVLEGFFLEILVFDLWWSERELGTCFLVIFWWVGMFWLILLLHWMMWPIYSWHVWW
jgi:hypothetical protein